MQFFVLVKVSGVLDPSCSCVDLSMYFGVYQRYLEFDPLDSNSNSYVSYGLKIFDGMDIIYNTWLNMPILARRVTQAFRWHFRNQFSS